MMLRNIERHEYTPSSSREDYKYCTYGCAFVFFALFAITPIVVISLGYKHDNEMSCYPSANNTNISTQNTPYTNLADTVGVFRWIKVYVACSLTKAIMFGVIVISGHYRRTDAGILVSAVAKCMIGVLYTFHFAWIIVGAVLFWRDCYNLSPKPINDMMWAILIMGFCGI